MERHYDAIVVGGGHNGLVTAAYLARGGLRTIVLERREHVGGATATETLRPGVRVPVLADTVGRLRCSVVRDLRLREHGLDLIEPPVRAFAPQPDGRAVTLWADPGRTVAELSSWSRRDAARYGPFDRKVRALASLLAHVNVSTPPDVETTSFADVLTGLRLVRALRGLGGDRQIRETLRILPLSVADIVREEFETDALCSVLASRGVRYCALGPRSAGTAAIMLGDSAGNDGGAAGTATLARGGPGALAAALAAAAQSFGAEVRCSTEVVAVTRTHHRATGVATSSGDEIAAGVVVSALDPKRTLLGLVDPMALGPELRWRAGNVRLPGIAGKVNLVLDRLPAFTAAGGDSDRERLTGRIVMAPGVDDLERAFDASKYGRVSEVPYLDATIPSLLDDTLAPPGRHVMSVLVQYAPYHLRDGNWDDMRDRLGDLVMRTLEVYAPGITGITRQRQVLTPLDLERDFGLTEGHPLHGETSLDQLFAWRPMAGYARYRLPLAGLYLCGAGAHPGGGVTGGPGANAAREILTDWRRR